jgi:hypothetical protein
VGWRPFGPGDRATSPAVGRAPAADLSKIVTGLRPHSFSIQPARARVAAPESSGVKKTMTPRENGGRAPRDHGAAAPMCSTSPLSATLLSDPPSVLRHRPRPVIRQRRVSAPPYLPTSISYLLARSAFTISSIAFSNLRAKPGASMSGEDSNRSRIPARSVASASKSPANATAFSM